MASFLGKGCALQSIPNMPLGGELQVCEAMIRRVLVFAFAEFVTFAK